MLPSQLNAFQLFQIFILAFLIFLVYHLLKNEINRQKYGKLIPSLKVRFILDILGHGHLFPYSYSKTGWNGYTGTAYILESLKSYFYLFKKEHISCAWLAYFPSITLHSPEAVEEILSGTRAVEKGEMYRFLRCWLKTGLLTSHGKKWRYRRKQLTPAFHFDILKDFLPVFNEKSQELVKILEKEISKDFTNIVAPITLCSLDIICETTLGVNIKAQENSTSDYVKAVAIVSDALTMRMYSVLSWFDFTYFLTNGRTIKKHIEFLHDFTTSVIQEKKKKLLNKNYEKSPKWKRKRKPLIDILLELHIEKNNLTEEDIREEVDTFTFEGHDTTSMALCWTCYLTGLHKDIQARAHEELDAIFGDDNERHATYEDIKDMKYIECIIKEGLRLFPPVPIFTRKADKNMTICGYRLPENSCVNIFPYMIHRNENIFPNAEKFDPERFTPENSRSRHPYAYIPFSAGPRNCIGQRFAMMELKVVFSHILRNYTLESLDPRDKVVDCIEVTLKPAKGIRIKIRPRKKTETKN